MNANISFWHQHSFLFWLKWAASHVFEIWCCFSLSSLGGISQKSPEFYSSLGCSFPGVMASSSFFLILQILWHTSPFMKPHKVITTSVDTRVIFSRCVLGEGVVELSQMYCISSRSYVIISHFLIFLSVLVLYR